MCSRDNVDRFNEFRCVVLRRADRFRDWIVGQPWLVCGLEHVGRLGGLAGQPGNPRILAKYHGGSVVKAARDDPGAAL